MDNLQFLCFDLIVWIFSVFVSIYGKYILPMELSICKHNSWMKKLTCGMKNLWNSVTYVNYSRSDQNSCQCHIYILFQNVVQRKLEFSLRK